ncbi:isoprenylcysteine carboxylmethyltransferase family protein [Microbacterium deminutum]|uniref:Isoprenylcysteine carboxylmethyltransferase family protein n=1 Tax=Microbacterium deminutum TaxID=344164 RepID=A0ABP5CGR1_9MICO
MGRTSAVIGSVIFFLVAPGVVAFLVPFLLGQGQVEAWRLDPPVVKWAGLALGAAGTMALIECFARFALKGRGTPAPIAPTEHLVVTGLYRYVRNPMYVAVLAIILAQAMWFASIAVLIYAAITWASFTAFVIGYEEPTLARSFGDEYVVYRANVHRWIPRLVPWHGPPDPSSPAHVDRNA